MKSDNIKTKKLKLLTTFLIVVMLFCYGCWNPFSPIQGINNSDSSLLNTEEVSDVANVFQLAYNQRNLEQYRRIFTDDFEYYTSFYKNGVKIEDNWSKEEEIRITDNMFKNAYYIDVKIFGSNFVPFNGDLDGDGQIDNDLIECTHSVNLTVNVTATLRYSVDSQAVTFIYEKIDDNWRIKRWIDYVN